MRYLIFDFAAARPCSLRSFLILCLSLSLHLSAQDTLSTVTVSAFREEASITRSTASVDVLSPVELRRFDQSNLVAAMNRLPGVRFEQRAPGSYRISVRGSTLRSPFGVRNIKIYWNGIPLTEPGGDTQLNFLDLNNIDRLELIKGPGGSLYGAGTAGTLLLGTDTLAGPAEGYAEYGSFQTFRAGARVQSRSDNGGVGQVRVAHQSTDGYRDHSGLSRQTAQLSGYLPAGRYGGLELHGLYTHLWYQLPGGLNPEQYAENRRQARPGSAETNASINYDNLLLSGTYRYDRGRWNGRLTTYATGFYFDHPFNFDYKRETNLGTGLRGVVDYTLPLPTAALKLSTGVESQRQLRMANNFGNDTGAPTDLNFSDEILADQHLVFGQATYDLGRWKFTGGISLNQVGYDVDRTFDAEAEAAQTASRTEWVAAPRLAALYDFGASSVRASISRGFSPPTLDEFRTNEGSLNAGLAPEIGTNYEIGYRAARGRLRYGVAVFYLQLDETITSFRDARGTQLFRNAGGTDQRGMEVDIDWLPVRGLRYYGAFTYHDFSYGDYERGGTDFSGNRLPGTAPFTTTQILAGELDNGLFADVYWNYTDAIPLNDAGTVTGEAYHLVRLRAGLRRGGWEFFLGADNLLDERYSLGNDLNPQFGNRYFQPAPERGWMVGLRYRL